MVGLLWIISWEWCGIVLVCFTFVSCYDEETYKNFDEPSFVYAVSELTL